MAHIKQLDQATINKIAAGEVIERPCAVVKELVENAIDAKASAITIEIKDGGISLIRITDNGSGIHNSEIETAFLRHATSKISSIEDLFSVTSLGFRGEALSSIAAVSQVELITKVSNELMGTRYVIEGGKEILKETIGCPEGTTFLVRNIFYNTPVRRKFLKTATTEASYISDYVEKLAISHPNISFKFISNGHIKLNTSGNNKQKDIIYNVYGREITSNIIEVSNHSIGVSVEGYIGKAIISRGNRTLENYFINGRYIKSSLINKAIEEAYKSYMMVHKYPFTLLNIRIDASLIDVNVHPTKMEIRFMNGSDVYNFIYETVKNALDNVNMIPEVELGKSKEKQGVKKVCQREKEDKKSSPEPFEVNRIRNVKEYANAKKADYIENVTHEVEKKTSNNKFIPEEIKETPIGKLKDVVNNGTSYLEQIKKDAKDKPLEKNSYVAEQVSLFDKKEEKHIEKKDDIKIIGQVFLTYWIVEYEGKMYIIDQHAAHEKVMYERLMKEISENNIVSQNIAPPVIVTLNMKEETYLKENIEVFEQLGFAIENFGGRDYSISAMPANLPGNINKDFFLDVLDNLMEGSFNKSDMLLEKVASMSCKAAVKGNNKMSFIEMKTLIEELFTLDNPFNCPHGRPTTIAITKDELEKKFKRQV